MFALIHAAYHQWPEDHEYQFEGEEKFRAWLLCKAGWHTARYIDTTGVEDSKVIAAAIEAAFRAADANAFVRVFGDQVAVFSPRSMAFTEADQREFAPIAQRIEEIIEAEVGVTSDQLLRERAA